MAKYFSLSTATFADDFKAALESYYGDGVTIESASGTTIIFQCPAVCDKVLKFMKSGGGFNAYIGDTSNSMTRFSYSSDGTVTMYHLILADAFILIDTVSTNHTTSALVAKLTNGRFMVSGGLSKSNSGDNYKTDNKCCFTDTMALRPIRMLTPYPNDLKSNRKLCLFPSFMADDMEMELNADGTFAYIPGLLLANTAGAPIVGGNYYLSQSGLYGQNADGTYCHTQKYVELEME